MALNYVTTLKFWEYFNLFAKVPQRSVGSSPTNEAVGTSDGSADQTFYLDQENIIQDTETIYVDGTAWTRVDDFSGSGAADTHYTLDYTEGLITFGDDTNGKIPPNTKAITGKYKYPSLDNVNNAGISDAVLTGILERAEARVDELCGRTWSNTTVTNELLDSNFLSDRDYFTFKRPVLNLTTFQVNLANDDEADNWTTLTEANNEIAVTLATGRVTITEPIFNQWFGETDINNKMPPPDQRNRIRITYNHGASSIPADIEELTLLVGAKMLREAVVSRSVMSGRDEFSPSMIDVAQSRIDAMVATHQARSMRSI